MLRVADKGKGGRDVGNGEASGRVDKEVDDHVFRFGGSQESRGGRGARGGGSRDERRRGRVKWDRGRLCKVKRRR